MTEHKDQLKVLQIGAGKEKFFFRKIPVIQTLFLFFYTKFLVFMGLCGDFTQLWNVLPEPSKRPPFFICVDGVSLRYLV